MISTDSLQKHSDLLFLFLNPAKEILPSFRPIAIGAFLSALATWYPFILNTCGAIHFAMILATLLHRSIGIQGRLLRMISLFFVENQEEGSSIASQSDALFLLITFWSQWIVPVPFYVTGFLYFLCFTLPYLEYRSRKNHQAMEKYALNTFRASWSVLLFFYFTISLCVFKAGVSNCRTGILASIAIIARYVIVYLKDPQFRIANFTSGPKMKELAVLFLHTMCLSATQSWLGMIALNLETQASIYSAFKKYGEGPKQRKTDFVTQDFQTNSAKIASSAAALGVALLSQLESCIVASYPNLGSVLSISVTLANMLYLRLEMNYARLLFRHPIHRFILHFKMSIRQRKLNPQEKMVVGPLIDWMESNFEVETPESEAEKESKGEGKMKPAISAEEEQKRKQILKSLMD